MSASPTDNDNNIDLITQSTYSRDGQLLSTTDPMNGVTNYSVDNRGRVITTVMPGATAAERPCSTVEYLQNGLVWKQHVATARGSGSGCPGTSWSDTEFEYDDAGRKTKEKKTGLTTSEYSGGEIVTQWAYDDAGRMTTITDPNGHEARFEYDEEGRRTKEERAVTLAGQSGPGCHGISGAFCTAKRWTYDEVGNVTREYQGIGTASSQAEVSRGFNWNPVNLLEELEDELGYVTHYTYDEDGNRLTETVPIDASTSSTTTWTYDEVGRLLTEAKTAGAQTITTTYSYDKLGNRATHEGPKNQGTTYHYDKHSRLDQVTDALNHASSFSYDKNGNRLTITDPENHAQTFTFDANNRLTSEQTPSAYACTPTCSTTARTASTTYTLDSLPVTATDFGGVVKTFGYDSARRLNSIDYSDSTPDVGYAYDKAGNRTNMSENGSTATTYTYDELNRQTGETRSSRTVAYGYDRRDNTTITYPDSKVVTQTFDATGRLQYVDDWRGSSAGRTAYSYDRAGRMQTRTLPSNAYTSWSYDTANRLTQVEHKASSGGSVLGRFSYTYDLAGNRLTQANYDGSTTKTQTFDYDALHRLTSEIPDTGLTAITYGYDKAGNRTSKSTGETYSYDADNRLLEIKLSGVSQSTFEYDGNGSTTLKKTVASGDETKYTYDGARRLTDVSTRPSGGSFTSQASFAYDGNGARASKTASGATTEYVNDTRGLTQILQQIPSAAPNDRISYVPGIAQFNPTLGTGAQWAYFHQDAQNNRLLTDTSAASSKRWDYEPFGTVRAQSGTAGSDFQYAGEQKDPETGLINLRARYYDPGVGRLLSRDVLPCAIRPGFPQTFNRYAYTLNNPLRYVDPSGYIEAGDCTGSNDSECSQYFDEWDDYHGDGDAGGDDDVDDWDQDGTVEPGEGDNRTSSLGPGSVIGWPTSGDLGGEDTAGAAPASASRLLLARVVPEGDSAQIGLPGCWLQCGALRLPIIIGALGWPIVPPGCSLECSAKSGPRPRPDGTPAEEERCRKRCDGELDKCYREAEWLGVAKGGSGCEDGHAQCLRTGSFLNPGWRQGLGYDEWEEIC
ncbi:MAG: RHS repeat-associated core domain-containing protein [Chloroflexi bacterium]|nr:RHS repeat-associated core domain-containing protein [Chloroflexota bacterium]